ncbi:MAG: GumC family protein [Nitrospirota bacterium]
MYKDLNLREYWTTLVRNWRIAVTVFTVFVASVLAITLFSKPIYEASSLIYIDTSASQFVPQKKPVPMDGQAYIETQVGILKSEALAKKVITRLNLDMNHIDDARSSLDILGLIGIDNDTGTVKDDRTETLRRFMSNLIVQPINGTNLLRVSFESGSPGLAAKAVNETVQAFMEQNLDMKVAPAEKYINWINGALGEIKNNLSQSARKLDDFRKHSNLVAGKAGNTPLLSLTDLSSKLLSAEAKRYDAEIKWRQAQRLSKKPGGLMSLPEVNNNENFQYIINKQRAAARLLAAQSKEYGDKNPRMVRLRNEISVLDRQVQSESDIIADSLKNNYEAALKSEQSIHAALAREKSKTINYGRLSNEYTLRSQDIDSTREMYKLMLNKLQESDVLGSMNISNVQLIQKAYLPEKPVRPNKPFNILIGLIFGALAGIGSAFAYERFEKTYSSPDKLEEQLGLPVIGMVPNYESPGDKYPGRIAVDTASSSPVAESFRTLRSNLRLSDRSGSPAVIQICSALQSEGKSTISVNLACAMAAAGEKILLIDCDIRRPSLHRFFKANNNSMGLSGILSGKVKLEDAIITSRFPNLEFIPSGTSGSDSWALVGGETMRNTLRILREKYDRIIIDCPPYLGISDASMLSPLTDGAIIVVRSGQTSKKTILKLKKNLEHIKAVILGVVLNDMKLRTLSSYYHYDYSNYIKQNKRVKKTSVTASANFKSPD